MSLDDALDLAADYARKRDYDSAIRVLAGLLATAPDHPEVLHGLGAMMANKGDSAKAAPFLLTALRKSRNPGILRDLVATFTKMNAHPELAALCDEFPDLVRGSDAGSLNGLALGLNYQQRYSEARTLLRRAAELAPGNPAIWHNLSIALIHLGEGEASVEAFAGKTTAWTGEAAHRDLVREYVGLAPTYDDNTVHASFGRDLWDFARRAVPTMGLASILELGCGTGLLATHLPNDVGSLIGIDLSPSMLAVAATRNRYHRLIESDFVAGMATLESGFDAVFSSGALCYVADLQPVFREVARLLSPGGAFLFSVDPSPDGQDIGVTVPGEYCHSRQYLRRLAAHEGLSEIDISIHPFRPTPGFYCAFRRS